MMVTKTVVGESSIVRASLSERQPVSVNDGPQRCGGLIDCEGGRSERQACTVNPPPRYLL
jgi:hypothetical protein